MRLFSFSSVLIKLTFISLPLINALGCKKNDSAPPPTAPAVTTTPLTNITTSSATTGGTILTNGNAAVTQSGIVWSKTNATPTLTDSVIAGTTSSGSFTTNLTGLDFNTVYYIRAFATNSVGIGYGDVVKLNTTNDTSKVRFTYNGKEVIYGIVISSVTGKKWLDRNLGATRVATSYIDYQAYGDLFQWGRPADGHQLINWTSSTTGTPVNGTTTVLATSDIPGDSNFIIISPAALPADWRTDNNRNRWNTIPKGPCPSGWHVPTSTEWLAEVYINAGPFGTPGGGTSTNGGIKDTSTAYSQLKLTATGYRYAYGANAGQNNPNGVGNYWLSSDVINDNYTQGEDIQFGADYVQSGSGYKAVGESVRCIKD
jgi:uncharacterized protein (TIGR02145 family)